jgi:hypothetical protein
VSGPWLQTALLCRKLSIDEAGRATAIDIVDGVAVAAGEPLKLHLVIALVRGSWQGVMQLRVMAFDPEGEPIVSMEVEGDPPDIPYAQSQIVVPIELTAGRPGVYWFDVQIDGTLVTRVPLRVDWNA